jgi:uncharacterized protein involved in exopolysaccharide biosynthesis
MILQELDTECPHFEARGASPVPGTALSVHVVLAVLWLSRRTILAAGAVTFGLATLLAFLLPFNFTASASFVPPGSSTESSAAALMGQLSSFGGMGGMLENKNRGDLYVAILKSRTIAQQMVQRFHLMQVYGVKKESLAEKKLASRSLFSVGTKDPVVTIAVTDHSPQRARDLAAGYLHALQETSANLSLTESSQRRLFYEQRLAREKDELANAEVALKQVEEKTGLVAPAGQTASNIQALAQIQAQITSQQARLAALLHDETDENPEVLRARSEIASLQAKAAEMESGSEQGFGRLSTAQVPETELEYIRKAREVKYHEALFDIIAKQYEAARLDEARDAPLQVLDQPVVPDTKSGPPRSIIMAAGLLLGLLGSSAWAVFRASRT